MLIPLGTDHRLRRPSVVTPALVAVTVLAFVAQEAIAVLDPDLSTRLLDACMVVGGERFRWWQLITSAFLHGGFMHLAGNMLFLWVFGPPVEDRFGRLGFLAFYLAGAAASGGVHALLEFQDFGNGARVYVPALGASGAISAVTGAFLVLFPMTVVRVLLFFFIIGRYMIPAWWFIGFQIVWNFVGPDDNVAYKAHLAGYAFGFVLSLVLLWAKVFPREPYDLLTLGRQAHRRRQFREAHAHQESQQARRAARAAHSAPNPQADRAAAARLVVANRLDLDDGEGAGEAYVRLLKEYGADAARVTLSPKRQNRVADELFRSGDYVNAASAYSIYLDAFGEDTDAGRVRLMLGLIYARYLNNPVEARPLLERASSDLSLGDDRALAEEVLEELG